MNKFNVPYISILLTTRFVWFVSSEFKWLWLAAESRCLQCDGVVEVGMVDEEGGLTIQGCGGGGGGGGLYKI